VRTFHVAVQSADEAAAADALRSAGWLPRYGRDGDMSFKADAHLAEVRAVLAFADVNHALVWATGGRR